MKYFFSIFFFLVVSYNLSAQEYKVAFFISDEHNRAVESATITLNKNKIYVTDTDGKAFFRVSGSQQIQIDHIAYEPKPLILNIYSDTLISIVLHIKIAVIEEVEIVASRNETVEKLYIIAEQLSELRGNTLMSKLEHLPGVGSIDIGQGFSKPVIRGLYANRVAVSENGIKQQGQQWGMDHGLEIDPYSVEQVAIIKGPASLEYGSDAIGGIIAIAHQIQHKEGLQVAAILNARSNNDLLGSSIGIDHRKGNYFTKGRISYQSYGDYRVPAHSFEYLGYTMPIYNKQLKNTAGNDNSLLLSTGIKSKAIESSITVSNVYGKMGFFSGAHGIPGKGSLDPDGSNRNIELPYQNVNHLKAVNNNKVSLSETSFLNFDFGYQFNHRREYAIPHTHGSQPLPESTLELDLRLHTLTGNIKWKKYLAENINISTGINSEFQNNIIGGYSFLLPHFRQQSAGIYSLMSYQPNKDITLQGGLRYDWGKIKVDGYTDNYIVDGFQRATDLNNSFDNFSFNLGASIQITPKLNTKINVGKSFRMPTANELSSNGVHHGTFRYELGNSTLKPETAYQTDASFGFQTNTFSFSLSGFITYFDNYIYLDPTGEYSVLLPNGENVLLPDVGQIYKYTGGRTFRWGGEADLDINITRWLALKHIVEYVYATDTEHNYPISFTPPLGITNSINFKCNRINKIISKGGLSISHKFNASQNRIRNEDTTPSSHIFDILFKTDLFLSKKANTKLVVGLNNIFDKQHFNHISFYRHLGLPEAGRNATLTLVFNFK